MKRTAANRVNVSILHRFLRFSREETSRLVRRVLKNERAQGWTIGIVFVPDERMRAVHREYLGERSTTDVLTFVYADSGQKEGEVLVCLDQARRQARQYRVAYSEEVARLVIHGVMHLLGYDDRRPRERSIMKQREDMYVKEAYARTHR